MAEAKPLASLSSSLLARKGHAKPAMRPQGYGFSTMSGVPEDLGWNDMGFDPGANRSDENRNADAGTPARLPIPLTPSVSAAPAEEPAVVTQQKELERELGAVAEVAQEPEPAAAPVRPVPVPVPVVAIRRAREAAAARTGKAAFTLRLDPARHLKLRLACAIDNRSAQQLVTHALDELLAKMPELDALAGHLPARQTGSNAGSND